MKVGVFVFAVCTLAAMPAVAQSEWLQPGDLTDFSVWNSADFLAHWPARGKEVGGPGITRVVLAQPGALLGLPIHSAGARFVRGEIDSLSIVFLDAGDFFGFQGTNLHGMSPQVGRKTFDETFARDKAALLSGLQAMSGRPPTPFEPGEHGAFRAKALLFHAGNVWPRVLAVDHQLLMVDFFRSEKAARSLKSGALPPAPVMDPRAPRDTAGDKEVDGIPMVVQGNRGYCGVATLAMIGQYAGLQPGVEEYAALSGYQYGETKSPDIRDLCARVAQEAGLHSAREERFDFDRARISIDEGLPVLAFRRWSPQRDYLQTLYTGRMTRGEAGAALPEPNMEDRKSWPGKDAPAHASIVVGYNLPRREVIFTESWGEQTRNRRMRTEELEATSYYAVYFTR